MASDRNYYADQYPETPLLFMDPDIYDKAIIGVIEGKAHELAVAYDYDKVIDINVEDGMTHEEAVEYFNFNQIDAYMGKHTPVFINVN